MANLDWLVVRDFSMIESATFWKDGPEIETGELGTEDIGTEVFFLPAAAHTEKNGSFTNTQRMLQWHHQAVEPPGDARSELWFYYHLGRIIRRSWPARPIRGTARCSTWRWDYPTEGPIAEPSAEAVLAEINGRDARRQAAVLLHRAERRRARPCGCWIYCGVYADGSQPGRAPQARHGSRAGSRPDWGWAWPANRRILYNRASADPDGKPWSERKAYVWWDEEQGKWTGHDVPDFEPDKRPDYEPPEGADRRRTPSPATTRSSCSPTARLAVRAVRAGRRAAARALRAGGVARSTTCSTASSATRRARRTRASDNRYHPAGSSRAARCSRTCSRPTGSPSTTPPAG